MNEADFRAFMQEMILRFDRRERQLSAQLTQQWEAEERRAEEMNRKLDELHRKTDDIVAEGRAGREALFRIFDKLDNGGTAPAA